MRHSTKHSLETFDGEYMIASPRSLQACLLKGIDPVNLMRSTPQQFAVDGMPEEAVQIKYQHFEMRRQQKISMCLEERARIIRALERPASGEAGEHEEQLEGPAADEHSKRRMSKSHSMPVGLGSLDKPQTRTKSSVLEREMKRLAKVKARQKAEIDGILAHERHLVKLHEEAAIAEEKDRERQATFRLKREKAAEERANKKAEMEQKKYELEQEEAERAKVLALRNFKEQQRLAEIERVREIQVKKMKERNERERQAKTEARRRRTKAILKRLEDEADVRMQKLEEADRRRVERTEEERAAVLAKSMKKSADSAARIKRAVDAAAKELEDRRIRVAIKNEEAAKVREEREAERAVQHAKMMESRAEKQERQRELLDNVYLNEDEKIRQFETHLRENTGQMAKIEAERAKQRAIYKAKRDLKVMDKLDNVAQQLRVAEYKRVATLQKIEQEEERQRQIEAQKKMLYDSRKKDEREAMKRKNNLKRSMDYIRATAKWNLIEYLDDEGLINRRKQRGKKKKGDDDDGDDEKGDKRMSATN